MGLTCQKANATLPALLEIKCADVVGQEVVTALRVRAKGDVVRQESSDAVGLRLSHLRR